MKHLPLQHLGVYTFVLSLLLSSCATLSYDHPMPDNSRVLNEIPGEFHGDYVQEDDENSYLEIRGNHFTTSEMTATIGEELELRPFQKYIVVNLREDMGWVVYLAERTGEGHIRLYHIDITEEEVVEKLNSITATEIMLDEEGNLERIKINPTDAEFKQMIESELFEAAEDFIPKAKK